MPTQKIAEASQTGPATVIIKGIGTGMISTMVPVVIISVAIMLSYLCANGFDMSLSARSISTGLYGIGIAAVGMLSTLGITLATDAYGPIADNAGGNAEMILPSLLAIIIPIVVGLVLGVAGVLGLLTGGLAAGFTLAVFMSNSGGAWDNAKKMIEEGNYGGKGSENHKATIVGDTVGDPFKDTSGPSLNILIKLMSMVSIVMAGLTIAGL